MPMQDSTSASSLAHGQRGTLPTWLPTALPRAQDLQVASLAVPEQIMLFRAPGPLYSLLPAWTALPRPARLVTAPGPPTAIPVSVKPPRLPFSPQDGATHGAWHTPHMNCTIYQQTCRPQWTKNTSRAEEAPVHSEFPGPGTLLGSIINC